MELLTGVVQPYPWGSTTAIPELLGEEPTGEPQAELWLGAHPAAPATVAGNPLTEIISRDPERYLGAQVAAAYGTRLPYLVKLLAAVEPLSLQAHPSREQATAGFAREEAAGIAVDAPERIYSEDWPKPEMICALENFEALCGFRDPSTTYRLFEQLGAPTALDRVAPLRGGGSEDLEAVFGRLLRAEEDPGPVIEELATAARQVEGGAGELAQFARTAVDLADRYPDDPGVLAALLLNRVALTRHEAIYLPAGNLHAYLSGTGVEVMANSDTVLRGGLTGKHVAVEELLKILDFTPIAANPVSCTEEAPGVWRYATPAPEFAVWRLEVGDEPISVPAAGCGRVLLVTEGSLLARAGAPLDLRRGQAAFLTASDHVVLTGRGTAFAVAPGICVQER